MRGKQRKRQKFKRTTISLPYDLWETLRIESIKRNISMGELIAKKLKELEKLKEKTTIMQVDEEGLLKPLE
ncbi:chromosome segregation protein SMC [Pampinifervens florentissimum]|uniref:chromosome segregation protein SMC n=1 Tax=Pampinifervens florentissimum TaxID=1632019 RepID=UPI0013B48D44|nr:chromosome segregation protein SMC [Hydrogenobacter sp. T-8]QID33511.1 chromosome segregation protein SMC [Hydrogenobacter sp. T-8]